MIETNQFATQLTQDGFTIVPGVVDEDSCACIASHLETVEKSGAGTRTLLDHRWCADLAESLRRHSRLIPLLPVDAVAVQCTLFDKSPANNWLVSWHQDLSIPVKARVDHPSCVAWSEKEGRLFTQPPAEVLEQLLAVRLHVDSCPSESGALRLVPGSHLNGRLAAADVLKIRQLRGEQAVPASRGDVLVMRPMILHASSKATDPASRRVLHFLYGPPRLPLGLTWR